MIQPSIIEIWNVVDVFVQEKLGRVSYSTFQRAVRPVSFLHQSLILSVPNNFMKKWVFDKCEHYIKKAIKAHFDLDVVIEVHLLEQKEDSSSVDEASVESSSLDEPVIIPAETSRSPQQSKYALNQKYSFDTFVVGACNRFPHAASIAVSKAPGKAYNPLFLYGGVGLGKTHLMHAIGNRVSEENPSLIVLYLTAEDFTNDLIHSIQHNKMLAFRDKYRNVDVLLIDDVQFIVGKEKTEEEFFHTFNHLYQSNKQIVVSSDRLPKDIPSIHERLKSRFEWGLSADLQSPDLETRIAILYKKLEPQSLVAPKEVMYYLASQIPENIRELEGALIKIVAYASLVNQQINITLAKDVIKDIVKDKAKKPVSLNKIKKQVADYYELDVDLLSAKIRTKEIAHARQVAMFLCRDLTNFSLPKIGESFGNRDHTTVMHACDKVNNDIKKNHDLKSAINQIKLILTE